MNIDLVTVGQVVGTLAFIGVILVGLKQTWKGKPKDKSSGDDAQK